MRKSRRRQIEHVKWRLANPKTPLWVKNMDKVFRKLWAEADKMFTPPQPTYFVDPSSFEKFKGIAQAGALMPPMGSIFAGVDIAENSALDEGTIVYANRKPDGTVEILGVQKL